MKTSYTYIPNYIGTFPIKYYEVIRKIVTPIVKKHLVGLRGRGRGVRQGHPTKVSSWSGREYHPNYQSHLPLDLSERVSFYIRVEPTNKFSDKYQKKDERIWDTIRGFESEVCPTLRTEILQKLEDNGIEPIRIPN